MQNRFSTWAFFLLELLFFLFSLGSPAGTQGKKKESRPTVLGTKRLETAYFVYKNTERNWIHCRLTPCIHPWALHNGMVNGILAGGLCIISFLEFFHGLCHFWQFSMNYVNFGISPWIMSFLAFSAIYVIFGIFPWIMSFLAFIREFCHFCRFLRFMSFLAFL